MFRNKKHDTTEPVDDGDTLVGAHTEVRGEHMAPAEGGIPPDAAREQEAIDEQRGEHVAPLTAREENKLRREEFGGLKGGAVFFGWLDAVALTILLVGIVSAVATAVGSSLDVTQSEAELRAGSIGAGSAVALLATLVVGYFAGGYVAGRLARFNGIRQGVGVWLFGLIITIIVAVVGTVFGDKYNVFDRVSLPSLPVRTDEVTMEGVVTGLAILLATLFAAVLGGMLGQRFHTKIDRTAL